MIWSRSEEGGKEGNDSDGVDLVVAFLEKSSIFLEVLTCFQKQEQIQLMR